jgi:hypothetical protein
MYIFLVDFLLTSYNELEEKMNLLADDQALQPAPGPRGAMQSDGPRIAQLEISPCVNVLNVNRAEALLEGLDGLHVEPEDLDQWGERHEL